MQFKIHQFVTWLQTLWPEVTNKRYLLHVSHILSHINSDGSQLQKLQGDNSHDHNAYVNVMLSNITFYDFGGF